MNRRTLLLSAAATAAMSACATSGSTTPGESALDRDLNAFFERSYEAGVERSPMQQTFLGRKTNYDKWDDPTERADRSAFDGQDADARELSALLSGPRGNPAPQTALSARIWQFDHGLDVADRPFLNHGFRFDQMNGLQQSAVAFMINQHKVTSPDDMNAYIKRLDGLYGYMTASVARADDAARQGIAPPAWVFEDYAINQARNVIRGAPFGDGPDSPLWADAKTKIAALNLTPEARIDMETRARTALLDSVKPAYERLITRMQAWAASSPAGDGAWRLPNGAEYYKARLARQTTTSLTPDEIHALGLSEVARIHGEIEAVMASVSFRGTRAEFFRFLREDPRFYYPDTEEGKARYLSEATALINDMRTRLDAVFKTKPKADIEVRRVEAFRERGAGKAFYQRPAADGSRPGVYYANLSDMRAMPIYEMAALAYHEGIPGHHMQIAIAQELEGIPSFRKFGGFTPYSEGWALYTEFLPKEMGLYQDPYSNAGRLTMELWRAARLVTDTGLHHKRWTRAETKAWLMANTPAPEGECQRATDRYIVMPGQACAYTIGMQHILQLRAKAKASMGARYDVRDFHDVVLRNGAVPLDVLTTLVNTWVAG
jgi:uncharacterized protein (DUF885 family)